MKASMLFIAGVIAATSSTAAADFSRVDLRPYILFSSHLVIPNTFEPSKLSFEEQQQFITQGGATFSSLAIQVEQQIPSSQVYRGVATSTQLRDLKNKLNAAKIRGQRSCEADTLGSQSGYTDFTWYSILGRRNVFRVVFARRGTSGLPPCQASLSVIITALQDFEFEVLANSDTEVRLTPP